MNGYGHSGVVRVVLEMSAREASDLLEAIRRLPEHSAREIMHLSDVLLVALTGNGGEYTGCSEEEER